MIIPFWMGTDVAEFVEMLPNPKAIKVHRLMCTELKSLVDKISIIFPEIEAARPRCPSGIESLVSLNRAIEKAKLLLQYCSESSMLYLALTGDVILSRCERSRKLLEQSLHKIQNLVPVMLAVEISRIIGDLRSATFILDPTEDEVGKAIRSLLHPDTSASDSIEISEIATVKLAASRLCITSSRALLIEKRSIKKLLDKVSNNDPKKQTILKYLMYLLKQYGKLIVGDETENTQALNEGSFQGDSCVEYEKDESKNDSLRRHIPPEQFLCPLSLRLMYDPVIIDSGQTFERMWIQKWFNEGNDVCPKTQKRLAHTLVTPNTIMKDLISKWCMENEVSIPDPYIQPEALQSWDASSTSITSFGSSINDLRHRIDFSNISLGSLDASYSSDSSHVKITHGLNLTSTPTDENSGKFHSFSSIPENSPAYLSELASLSWEFQCKAVEEVKDHLFNNDQACRSMSTENLVDPLIRFLKDARDQHDLNAQRSGSQLLLAYVSKTRSRKLYLREDAFDLLAYFLESELREEALAMLEVLSGHQHYRSKIAASGALTSILKILDTQLRALQEPALKILCNLSSNSDIRPLIASLECIPKLVPLLTDLANYCIIVLKNLCETEEGRVSVAETNGCLASIVELLAEGNNEDREHAVDVLLSLCSQRVQYCRLVMSDGVINALDDITANGTDRGKASALELLRILGDVDYTDVKESSGSGPNISGDSGDHAKEKKSSTKTSGFFGRKISVFSRPNSVSSKKKK